MKKLIIVICMLMIANLGFAQSNTKLQGPKAKNAKPWTKKSKKAKLVYTKNRKFLKGPAAKNAKPWHKSDSDQVYAEVESTNRPDLKGPKAKNFKPWTLPVTSTIDSMVVKEKAPEKIKLSSE